MIECVIFYKKLNLGSIGALPVKVTGQNIYFTKIAFSQSNAKIETSGWNQNIDKNHSHLSVTISAQIDARPVM